MKCDSLKKVSEFGREKSMVSAFAFYNMHLSRLPPRILV